MAAHASLGLVQVGTDRILNLDLVTDLRWQDEPHRPEGGPARSLVVTLAACDPARIGATSWWTAAARQVRFPDGPEARALWGHVARASVQLATPLDPRD